jgi:hypothetical protein
MNQEVIEKIRKILVLANNAGATEGEVQSAMAQAKKIAMRHQIDIATVDLEDKSTTTKAGIAVAKDNSVKIHCKYERPYHRYIFNTLMEVFGVMIIPRSVVRNRSNREIVFVNIVGETTDVEICKVLIPWLEKVFPDTYKKFLAHHGIEKPRAAFANGCYHGLMSGIIEANKVAEEELGGADAEVWAVAVVDKEKAVEDAVAEAFPNLITRKAKRTGYSHGAAAYGHSKGKEINLGQVAN